MKFVSSVVHTNVPLRSDFWSGVVGTAGPSRPPLSYSKSSGPVAAATGPYRAQSMDEVQKLRDVGINCIDPAKDAAHRPRHLKGPAMRRGIFYRAAITARKAATAQAKPIAM